MQKTDEAVQSNSARDDEHELFLDDFDTLISLHRVFLEAEGIVWADPNDPGVDCIDYDKLGKLLEDYPSVRDWYHAAL